MLVQRGEALLLIPTATSGAANPPVTVEWSPAGRSLDKKPKSPYRSARSDAGIRPNFDSIFSPSRMSAAMRNSSTASDGSAAKAALIRSATRAISEEGDVAVIRMNRMVEPMRHRAALVERASQGASLQQTGW